MSTFREILKKENPLRKSYTFSEIMKFNPYHDRLGRFSSAGGAASFTYAPGKSKAHDNAITAAKQDADRRAKRSYGSTPLGDAIEEISNGTENSLSKYIDKDGNLTPEREALHRKIIDDYLYGKTGVEGQATMRMNGGGPASGKGSLDEVAGTFDKKHHLKIDPDDIKEKLPGYKEMTEKTTEAAGYYHEESSALAKRIAEVCFSENLNVTYDGTGDGSINSVMKKIDGARAHGYKVTATYATVDVDEALKRNQARYDHAVAEGKPARLPNPNFVAKCHAKVTNISLECADKFDSIELYDNNGPRGSTKLIAKGGNGKGLTAVPGEEAAFAKYVAKGK